MAAEFYPVLFVMCIVHCAPFTFLNFKFSDFNKEPTSSLKMI